MLIRFIVLFSFLGLSSFAQTFYSGFEDSSSEGWTKSQDNKGISIISEETYNYLNASFEQGEEMAIVNQDNTHWSGNYFINVEDDLILRTVDDVLFRNPNSFDLYIRYGFKGANGVTVVTSTPIVVKAHSEWEAYYNYYGFYFEDRILDNLTITSGLDSNSAENSLDAVRELFEDVIEFKIFHNPDISYQAKAVAGVIEMESIVSFGELSRPKAELPTLNIIPNPFVDRVELTSDKEMDHIVVYNAQGTTVLNQTMKSNNKELFIGNLTSGVYLFEVHFSDGSLLSKQLVRQ